MKKGVLCLLLGLSLAGCNLLNDILPPEPVPEGGEFSHYTQYTIEAGSHHAGQWSSYFSGRRMVFEARFDSTAIYTNRAPDNQLDINKLYGFSDCAQGHHKSSARFGWRWYNNELQIFAYGYAYGNRYSKYITSVPLNQKQVYVINVLDDRYQFEVGTEKAELERECSGEVRGYRLYPYFGGDEQAPQTINIWLNEI